MPFVQLMPQNLHAYWVDLWQMLCFSWQQATALPSGVHAEFAKYGVDAVTIQTYLHPHKVWQRLLIAHAHLTVCPGTLLSCPSSTAGHWSLLALPLVAMVRIGCLVVWAGGGCHQDSCIVGIDAA